MKNLNANLLPLISAGYYHYAIYPVAGCGTFTTLHYLRDPQASRYELGRSCFKGALHGTNFGINFIGGSIPHALIRYNTGVVFADMSNRFVDNLLPQENTRDSYTCPFYVGDDE